MKNYWIGETLGTFILVFIGCGSVAYSIVNPSIQLWEIALIWGLGVFLGIQAGSKTSHSHLNPAVSFGYFLRKKIDLKRFAIESLAQLTGAILAGFALFGIFNDSFSSLEETNNWSRSDASGLNTAKAFGEYYDTDLLPMIEAFTIEGFGTAILMYMILLFGYNYSKTPKITAVFIGLTVSTLIIFIAPYTQCGINPARDFGPRLVSWIVGWKHAFSAPDLGAILVYVVAPFLGSALAVYFRKIINRNDL